MVFSYYSTFIFFVGVSISYFGINFCHSVFYYEFPYFSVALDFGFVVSFSFYLDLFS